MFKVMLVDDNRIVMEGIAKIISHFNLPFGNFLICGDGSEALEQLENFRPDVIITDIRMPEMDGIELSARIRSRSDRLSKTPIIIVSGYEDFNYARSAIQYRVYSYLLKPIDKDELYKCMQSIQTELEKVHSSVSHLNEREEIIQRSASGTDENREWIRNAFQKLDQSADSVYRMISVGWLSSNFHAALQIIEQLDKYMISAFARDKSLLCYCCMPRNRDITDLLTSFPGKGIKILVSDSSSDPMFIFEAYFQIRRIEENLALLADKAVVKYQDVIPLSSHGPVDFPQFGSIVGGIGAKDYKAVEDGLIFIEQFLGTDKKHSIEYVKSVYNALCLGIYRRYYSISLDKKLSDHFGFLSDSKAYFDHCNSLGELAGLIKKRLLQFAKEYAKESAAVKDGIVQNAIFYLHKNYSKPDTTLAKTARDLYVSSQYLSALFKKETGQTFHYYLSSLRVEKAKELLGNNNYSIARISQSVGYPNEKHFFVVFKKLTGQSPAKYRYSVHTKTL